MTAPILGKKMMRNKYFLLTLYPLPEVSAVAVHHVLPDVGKATLVYGALDEDCYKTSKHHCDLEHVCPHHCLDPSLEHIMEHTPWNTRYGTHIMAHISCTSLKTYLWGIISFEHIHLLNFFLLSSCTAVHLYFSL